MDKGSELEIDEKAVFADAESNAAFLFGRVPEFFRAKDATVRKRIAAFVDEAVGKARILRTTLEEQEAAKALSEGLLAFEGAVRGLLAGHASLGAEELGKRARAIGENLRQTNGNMAKKDFWLRCFERLGADAKRQLGMAVHRAGLAWAEGAYREMARRMTDEYTRRTERLKKPYAVEFDAEGDVVGRAEVLDRDEAVYLGDGWVRRKDGGCGEFAPPADLTLPVALSQSFRKPGWLAYEPSGSGELKARLRAILSNVLFHRLLVGLPDVKVVIWDCGTSSAKGYEHDLGRDLTHDPQSGEAPVERYADFGEFKRRMEELVDAQPEDYERRKNNPTVRERLVQIYAVLVMPNETEERRLAEWRGWIEWCVRQAPRGVGLYGASPSSVLEAMELEEEVEPSVLRLDGTGNLVSLVRDGEWGFEGAAFREDWAESDAGWNAGRCALNSLIMPKKPEEPGTVRVYFADKANGEPQYLTYTSQRANTVFVFGRQGSGKTAALSQLLLRAAEKYGPNELVFYVFDFKNSLGELRKLRHVACLVFNENEHVILGALRDINAQLDLRQRLFAEVQERTGTACKDLDAYNRLRQERERGGEMPQLPRILVFVDECKNMLDAKLREIGALLDQQLLSRCRSAGVHFLFSTTEDKRASVGKAKFDATVEMWQPEGREERLAMWRTADDEAGVALTMPELSRLELERTQQRVEAINRKHRGENPFGAPLYFPKVGGEADANLPNQSGGVAVEQYAPFRDGFELAVRGGSADFSMGFGVATGIAADWLRTLHFVPFKKEKRGQGLAYFGRWAQDAFRAGMGLLLRSLEMVAGKTGMRVDILDAERRFGEAGLGVAEEGKGAVKIWTERKDFLEVKREWLAGNGNERHVLVAVDAEDSLGGETDYRDAVGGVGGKRPVQEPAFKAGEAPNPSDLAALMSRISSGARENTAAGAEDNKTKGPEPEDVDRRMVDMGELAKASLRGRYIVLVTEKPRTLKNMLRGTLQDAVRFVAYRTAEELGGLENAPADNMGYYAEAPGDQMPREHFLAFDSDGFKKDNWTRMAGNGERSEQ